ncbi:unnamed protein product [Ostreobium quekettii]|uniref:Protein kinase domain-containing protein n=1 Tax=Ostreobium quekettii TaxID=121088 RepID=A0A8S1JAX7_9CHLO|nr:unnamed protein product [Ostreobium quekettii]
MGRVRSSSWSLAAYATRCLSFLLAVIVPISCLETENQFGFVSINNHINTTVVADCEALQEALRSEVEDNLIVVIAYIRCDPTVWDQSVVVYGNKTVTGPGHGVIVGAVDWGSGDGVVVVGNGSSLTFQDIIILQDYLGANALLNLQFLSAGTESNAFLKGVAVGVGVCPQPVGIYDKDLRDLERPGHIPGEQEAARLDVTGLFVRDVAFSPYGDSTWQQCNVIWRCGVMSALEPKFLKDFNDELVSPVCGDPLADGVSPLGVGLRRRRVEKVESEEDKAAIGISLSVLGLFLVIVVVGALMLFRHRGKKRRRKADEIQRKIKGPQHNCLQPMDGPGDVLAPRELCSPHLGSTSTGNFPNVFKMDLADVELGKRLKRGKSGSVYKCSYQGVPVAVKVVDHRGEGLQEDTGEPLEAELCKQMLHGNVVATYLYKTVRFDSLFSSTHTTWNRGSASIMETRSGQLTESGSNVEGCLSVNMDPKGYRTFIVMEYCNGGSLLKGINSGAFFTQETGPLAMRALLTALDIARGVGFLHDMCIVHGDLRPESCLVKSEASNKKGFVCKVGDFKLSRYVADALPLKATAVGCTAYAAPELLRSGTLTKAADVYAMGMILWRLLSDIPAYKSMKEEEVVEFVLRGQRPEIPAHFSKGYRELVEACWHQDRARRPEFHQIVDRLQALVSAAAATSGESSARPDGPGSPGAVVTQQTWELLTESLSGNRIYTPVFPSGDGSTSSKNPDPDGQPAKVEGGVKDSAPHGGEVVDLAPKRRGEVAAGEASEAGGSKEREQEPSQSDSTASDSSASPRRRVCDSVADMPGSRATHFQEVDEAVGESERPSDSDRGSSYGRSFLSSFLAGRGGYSSPRGRSSPPRHAGVSRFEHRAPRRDNDRGPGPASPSRPTTRGRFQVSIATATSAQHADRMGRAACSGESGVEGEGEVHGLQQCAPPESGSEEEGGEGERRGSGESQRTSSGALPAHLPVPPETFGVSSKEVAAPGILLEVEEPMSVSADGWVPSRIPRNPRRAPSPL